MNKIDISDIVKTILNKTSEKAELEREIKNLKMMIARKMGDQLEILTNFGKIKKLGDSDIEIVI